MSGGKSILTLKAQGTASVCINIREKLQIPNVAQTQENADNEEEKEEIRIYRKMASSKKNPLNSRPECQNKLYLISDQGGPHLWPILDFKKRLKNHTLWCHP